MPEALRLLFDTNVYDELLEIELSSKLIQAIREGKLLVYGCTIIRKELRAIPRQIIKKSVNLRNAIIRVYETIVEGRQYSIDPTVESIAHQYAQAYNGRYSTQEMFNDFLIVACASVHGIDIIISKDNKTMCSLSAIEAYTHVNTQNKLKLPQFHGIERLRQLI